MSNRAQSLVCAQNCACRDTWPSADMRHSMKHDRIFPSNRRLYNAKAGGTYSYRCVNWLGIGPRDRQTDRQTRTV